MTFLRLFEMLDIVPFRQQKPQRPKALRLLLHKVTIYYPSSS